METIKNNHINSKRVLIVRYGEVALKGMNKPYFERVLRSRIENSIRKISPEEFNTLTDSSDSNGEKHAHSSSLPGGLSIERNDGLMVISCPQPTLPISEKILIKAVAKVFGVASVSPAVSIESKELDDIYQIAIDVMQDRLKEYQKSSDDDGELSPLTFKVYGKRSDKTYPIKSPEMSAMIGEAILNELGDSVKVNVTNPDIALTVHLRRKEVFIYDEKVSGFGGLPLGTNGKGMILLSGGIDSPVALWLMAKRGMLIEAVHFHSYPYTGKRAQEKVEELAGILASYCGNFKLHVINLLPAQEAIVQNCPEEMMTIIVRRYMMKIAEILANKEKCDMLITGESLGQVASQTAASLVVTDASVTIPVMRPLIALDKIDIMDIASDIGTYEKSIEPYEDCCTVFLPKHPTTKPKLSEIEEAEAQIPDEESLIKDMLSKEEVIEIKL